MGSGAFGLVWPITKLHVLIVNIKGLTLIKVNFSLYILAKENLFSCWNLQVNLFNFHQFNSQTSFNDLDLTSSNSYSIFIAFKTSNSCFLIIAYLIHERVWPHSEKREVRERRKLIDLLDKRKKSYQHKGFPSGPPP